MSLHHACLTTCLAFDLLCCKCKVLNTSQNGISTPIFNNLIQAVTGSSTLCSMHWWKEFHLQHQGIGAKDKIESSFHNMWHHDSAYLLTQQQWKSAECISQTKSYFIYCLKPRMYFVNSFCFEYEKMTLGSPFRVVASFFD